MRLPPADIHGLANALLEAAADVAEAYEVDDAPHAGDEVTPGLLAEAAAQLLDVLKRVEAGRRTAPGSPAGDAAPEDLARLGDYGFGLLGDLGVWAARLGLEARRHEMEMLALPLALWLARNGGELQTLEPAVNAAAAAANQTHDARELEELYAMTGELIEAAAPDIRQDLEKGNPGRPWRVLNINRAILATRTHNPGIMEEAFEVLEQNLPEEAPQFFREGMGQMEALNYPPRVREVMERYYRKWCIQRTLH